MSLPPIGTSSPMFSGRDADYILDRILHPTQTKENKELLETCKRIAEHFEVEE